MSDDTTPDQTHRVAADVLPVPRRSMISSKFMNVSCPCGAQARPSVSGCKDVAVAHPIA